ncbi:MAG: amino acid permease, partial [Ginsengibacter sp.]
MNFNQDQLLKRSLNRWDIVLLMINSIIGAGIFGIPSKIFSLTSIYSVFAILFCAIITLVFILIFAEVATQFERSGGPYLYTYEAFGKFPGFIIGWLALISRMAAFAAVINLLVDYLSYLNPVFTEFATRTITIILICGFLFIINSRSVKSSSSLNNILAIFKLLPLIAFVIIGFFFINAQYLELPKALPSTSSFASSIVILIFAFTGWEAVLINTGEMSNPAKNIPFAMIISTLFVAVFYILIQVVSIGTFP